MERTFDSILKDADKENTLQGLIDLWNEIANNKYNYTLAQLRFANEHISNLSKKMAQSDFSKVFRNDLKKMI